MTRAPKTRRRHAARLILCGTTATFAASYAAGALAADNGADAASLDSLQEITVTAQRREENARDVPISLTVFSGAQIAQDNFQGVESYLSQTPNVSFTSEGTRDRKELALRGVSDQLSPDNNIKEGSFGFYIDEFNVAQGTSNPRDRGYPIVSRYCVVPKARSSVEMPSAVPSISPPRSRPMTFTRR